MSTSKGLHFFQPAVRLAIVPLVIFFTTLSSCQDGSETLNPDLAHLEIFVYGTLSLKPREGIVVTLHASEAEAESGDNPLLPSQFTNEDGMAKFTDLTPGKAYWVRAKALLLRNVKETDVLSKGLNTFRIGIV